MKPYGSASAGMNDRVANFSLKITVVSSGSSILSTMMKLFCRGLDTPGGGLTTLRQVAATSCAVNGDPSWNLTPCRILNVKVRPLSVGVGISVHRSQTKSVVEAGLSGFTRTRTL